MALKLAIFGQAPVAVDCIDRLLAAGHEIAAVYAPEDGSRPDQLAARARELGLAVFQRRYFKKKTGEPIAAALADYEQLGVDLNVMASFTYFLPPEMTDAPTHGSICYHPSLLPRYRGGNALQWQIIDGEPEVGVSILTFGQYLQPTAKHLEVERYVTPEEFDRWKVVAEEEFGFSYCASGPMVRSSYKAAEVFLESKLAV